MTMAKYVGKIFKVPNNKLGIHSSGAHYVHVAWYNPFKRKFRCKVLTSLEEKKELIGKQIKQTGKTAYAKGSGNTFFLFKKRKYKLLREGKIQSIPVQNLQGFDVWSGYMDSRDLHISVLKNSKYQKDMKINK